MTLPPAALAALQQGNKIAAIKIVRAERNIGLKEAKDLVEQYVRSQPALEASFAAAQARMKQAALRWVGVLVLLLALAALYLST